MIPKGGTTGTCVCVYTCVCAYACMCRGQFILCCIMLSLPCVITHLAFLTPTYSIPEIPPKFVTTK